MDSIGVIGVGYIGKGFVENLLDADYDVTVYDINEEQIAWARDRGADVADSPAAMTSEVDCVIMALPGTPEVEATMGGDNGILADAEGLSLVIDASTTLPETSLECETLCEDVGIAFVEAPITGGSPREGMHMMVGGSEENYDIAAEVLDTLCSDHVRIGATGDATIFKLAIQLRYAGHHAVDAEVVSFLRDNGVDPKPLNEFLKFGIWEKYFSGNFSQNIEGLGGLAIWHKDLGYMQEVARENDTALPLASVLHEAYKATTRRVDGEGHAAALIKYWQTLNANE